MNIHFICTSSYVFGAEIVTLAVMRELRRRGHGVVAVPGLRPWCNGDFHQRLEKQGIPFRSMPLGFISKSLKPKYIWWTIKSLVTLPVLWWRFWQLCRRTRPDVVVLTTYRHALMLWPFLDRRRTLLHFQSGMDVTPRIRRRLGWIDRRLAGYVACSDFIARNYVEAGLPPGKIHVIKSGVVEEDALNASLGQPEAPAGETVRIGIVGQIGAWKGHDDLVAAAGLLLESTRNFRVVVFGSGDPAYVSELKAEVSRRSLDAYFEWRGFERDQRKIFSAIDICAVPSRFDDPFPTIALEAAGAGLPVVATRQGGLPEIVRNMETGFLVEKENPVELAAHLKTLIEDVGLRVRMGEAARAHAGRHFTQQRMGQEFESLVARITEAARKPN